MNIPNSFQKNQTILETKKNQNQTENASNQIENTSNQNSPNLNHVAIICDGNRRWAKAHGMEVFKGHEYAVTKVFEPLVDHAQSLGIGFITFWIFSTENWKRAKNEVDFLLHLFRVFFDEHADNLHKKNVRINVIGDITAFPKDIQEKIHYSLQKTKDNTGIVATLALNYGGRDELTRAVRRIAQEVENGVVRPEDITKEMVSHNLDTAGAHLKHSAHIPDPDIIVRPGAEMRLSGFLSWQHEYAEFIFPDYPFPEFKPEKLDAVVAEFANRQRRFGG